MKKNRKRSFCITFALLLFLAFVYLNNCLELIAFNWLSDTDDRDLRLLTWNIRSTHDVPEAKQRAIAKLILEQDADFVLLNEFKLEACGILHEELKKVYTFTEEEYANNLCGDIIYCKRELYSSGHKEIPVLGKSVPSISATIAVANDSIFITGVHLASNSGDGSAIINGVDSLMRISVFYEKYKDRQKEREYSTDWLRKWITDSQIPCIVMGDMNDFSCSPPLKSLTTVGVKDAWWEGGLGYGCTYHDGWMRLRIDHIYYSDRSLELKNVKVVETELSDHNPLIADFKMKK